jgi:PKHD-type hydroxylase
MNYQIFRLLTKEQAGRLVSELQRRTFTDGRLTAHGQAREVKNNLQLRREDDEATDLHDLVTQAFQQSVPFQEFAFPKRFAHPIFNCYDTGMTYGAHVDNAMMGGFNGIRTDLSVTVFLSDASSYEGGELMIHLPVGEEAIKLDAGEAIVYSSDTVHHVERVTRGVRLAAISWVQSAIRDERIRVLLRDLARCAQRADELKDAELHLLLTKSYQNLLRYAAEP